MGSHDRLGVGYAAAILEKMEQNPGVALAAGTIVHIDENGDRTGQTTRSTWASFSDATPPLVRVGECLTRLRKDCSIFYGVYRTTHLRQAWFDTPCLGFDRALLGRISAVGKILYVDEATFFARNLDKSRGKETDKDRRANVIDHHARKPVPKNVFLRNKMMVQTVLDQAHTPDDLGLALDYIQTINRRYQNRRRHQKRRLALAACLLLALAGFLAALYF